MNIFSKLVPVVFLLLIASILLNIFSFWRELMYYPFPNNYLIAYIILVASTLIRMFEAAEVRRKISKMLKGGWDLSEKQQDMSGWTENYIELQYTNYNYSNKLLNFCWLVLVLISLFLIFR